MAVTRSFVSSSHNPARERTTSDRSQPNSELITKRHAMNKYSPDRAAIALLFALTAASRVDAFVVPSQLVHCRASTSTLNALPEFNPFLVTDGLSAATYMGGSGVDASSALNGSLSALRTFFVVVTGAIFGITAIVYLTAAFLVPRAAEQLERDTKRLRPGLWEEYEAKLGEGEIMVTRPDLLQELGNIMQPIITKDYEKEAAMKFGSGNNGSTEVEGAGTTSVPTVSAPPRDGKEGVIDVTMKQQPEE